MKKMRKALGIASLVLVISAIALSVSSCTTRQVVAGAGIGGAAYEYSNKRAMDDLRDDYEKGRITREEYDRRKKEIEKRSVVY